MKSNTHAETRGETNGGFAGADRGISEILGAILMFGLIIALIALIQVNAVPAANEQVEFEHSHRVQGDLQSFQATVLRVASRGVEGSVRVKAGVDYPSRFFFLNPPPVTGTIRTSGAGTVTVDNVAGFGETGDYWDGSSRQFDTTTISYRPGYNEYANPPRTVYEHGVLYNEFDNDVSVVENPGSLVDGRRISLILTTGNLSVASQRSVLLGVAPVSAPARTITVTDDGSPIALTVPSRRPAEEWAGFLADEFVSRGGHVQAVEPGPGNSVRIVLEPGETYSMRTAAIGVGTGYDPTTDPAYIVDVAGNGSTIPENGTHRIVAEVRDEYNNPVGNVTVDATTLNGTVVPIDSNRTDAHGRVAFEYQAPEDVNSLTEVAVTATFGESPATPERSAEFALSVFDADGSGTTGTADDGSGGNPINPSGPDSVSLVDATLDRNGGQCVRQRGQGGQGRLCEVDVTFESQGATDWTVEQMRVSFYSASGDPGGSDVIPPTHVNVSDSGTSDVEGITIRGDFVNVDLDGFDSTGDRETYRFAFERPAGSPYGALQGDYFVVEIRFVDAEGNREISTYFVSPQNP